VFVIFGISVLGMGSSEKEQKMLQNEVSDVKKLVDTAENGLFASSKVVFVVSALFIHFSNSIFVAGAIVRRFLKH
jgi:hypothetical protein